MSVGSDTEQDTLGPLEHACADPARFDADEHERLRARFLHDLPSFYDRVHAFCNGEPGHTYGKQQEVIASHYHNLAAAARVESIPNLQQSLQNGHDKLIEQILSIPVPVDSVIHDAHTPFTTYCLVKDLCMTVRQELVWLDRYFDQTIFHRFFADTPRTARVTLVTQPAAALKGQNDKARHLAFMDVSRLLAQERGIAGYQLIETNTFHDRWLRCDDRLFTLGGSTGE